MSEIVKITTEKLEAKGTELLGMAEQARFHLQAAEEEVGQIESSFKARAAEQLKTAFGRFAQEGAERIRTLSLHLEKLQEIAEIYEEAEQENELVTTDY